MRNFLNSFNYKFQQFMVGRYGSDSFSKFLLIVSVIGFGLSMVTGLQIFYLIAVASLVYVYFRMFSKNIYARQAELRKYFAVKSKITQKINLRKKIHNERHTHKYIKCPKCKTVWRYPKGLGKIEVTCKSCKHKMIKRT